MYANDPATVNRDTISIAIAKNPPNASSEITSSENIADAGIGLSAPTNWYPT